MATNGKDLWWVLEWCCSIFSFYWWKSKLSDFCHFPFSLSFPFNITRPLPTSTYSVLSKLLHSKSDTNLLGAQQFSSSNVTISIKNHRMDQVIPWSRCCTRNTLSNEGILLPQYLLINQIGCMTTDADWWWWFVEECSWPMFHWSGFWVYWICGQLSNSGEMLSWSSCVLLSLPFSSIQFPRYITLGTNQ